MTRIYLETGRDWRWPVEPLLCLVRALNFLACGGDATLRYYAADLSVRQLTTMMEDGSLVIPAFQRGYVWTKDMASGFVVWLIKGFPSAQIVLMEDQNSVLHIVDGSQRLRTLLFFQQGKLPDGQEFALTDVGEPYEGATYASLSREDQLRLNHAILHAIVVKQEDQSDWDSVLSIFEVLNVTGVRLHRQEVRAALYPGGFMSLLRGLAEEGTWQALTPDSGAEQEELILRFFALLYEGENFKRPMNRFLDRFLQTNKNFEVISAEELASVFRGTVEMVKQHLGVYAFRPKRRFSQTAFNLVMVGIAKRLRRGPISDISGLKEAYRALINSEEFTTLARNRIWDERVIAQQLQMAEVQFGGIQ